VKGLRLAAVVTLLNLVVMVAVLIHARSTDAQPDTEVIRVRALELVGEQGQLRARLNVEPNGEVVFRLLDQAGTIRFKLGAGADGSGMVLLDDETEPGVQILAKPDGPAVTLTGKDGQQHTIKP
jgi:hypothetical protein